jgi:hypothetical protein
MEGGTRAVVYILFNMASSLGIVFANKAVFAIFKFPFPFLLTLIHIVFTALGMQLMAMVRYPSPCCGAQLWTTRKPYSNFLARLDARSRLAVRSDLAGRLL